MGGESTTSAQSRDNWTTLDRNIFMSFRRRAEEDRDEAISVSGDLQMCSLETSSASPLGLINRLMFRLLRLL